MPTYIQLRDRIANEMQRPDLNTGSPSPIALAVQDAVRHFQNESFYLNKNTTKDLYAWKWVPDTISTEAGGTTQSESRHEADSGDPYYASFLSTTQQGSPPAAGSGDTVIYDKFSPSLPTDFSQVITLSIAKDTTLYQLTKLPYEEVVEMDAIYATGANTNADGTTSTPHLTAPAYWTHMSRDGDPVTDTLTSETEEQSPAGAIRIYPRPDKRYNLLLSYETTLAAPVNDNDSIFWTNDAYRMIKCFSKAVLYGDYLQQFELAQANETMAQSEYNRIVSSSEQKAFPTTVVPSLF